MQTDMTNIASAYDGLMTGNLGNSVEFSIFGLFSRLPSKTIQYSVLIIE